MKKHIGKLLENDLFLLLMSSVFSYTAFAAVVIATIGIPPESILDSGLEQILLVFEG